MFVLLRWRNWFSNTYVGKQVEPSTTKIWCCYDWK
jgi:hypothetical protein